MQFPAESIFGAGLIENLGQLSLTISLFSEILAVFSGFLYPNKIDSRSGCSYPEVLFVSFRSNPSKIGPKAQLAKQGIGSLSYF